MDLNWMEKLWQFAGFSANALGDVNGDNYTDLLIGALCYNGGCGSQLCGLWWPQCG